MHYSKSYLLQGGTAIPSGADMNDYTEIGNYYCNANSIAQTLENCPTTSGFTLKVENAVGESSAGSSGYIRQTFTEYDTGRKIVRYRVNSTSTWQPFVYFSDDATLLGQTITYSDYNIPANGTMTIEEGSNNLFYQLVIIRGTLGTGYNVLLLTGYGIGTDSRYHYKLLDDGNAVDISISNTSFIITNKSSNNSLNARIFRLYGNAPTVSVS